MTLFDDEPPPPPKAPPDLPCRLTGCTRPFADHVVTQAAIENSRHPRPIPTKKKAGRK